MTLGRPAELPLLAAAGLLPLLMAPGFKDSYLLPKLAAAGLLVFGAAAAAFVRAGDGKAPATGLERPIAAFAAAALASALISIDGWPGWAGAYAHYSYGILGWSLCAAAFFLASLQPGSRFPADLGRWLAAGSAVVAAYAVLQWAGVEPYAPAAAFFSRQAEPRPLSTVGAPVPLGVCLMLAVAPSLALLRAKGGSDRVLGGSALAVVAAALVLTRTRGAWVGALGGAAVYLWLDGAISRRRSALLLAAVLVCGAGLLLMRGRRTAADAARLQIWRTAVDAFRDHPVLGVGTGAFGAAFRLYQGTRYARAIRPSEAVVEVQLDAHDDWLQVLSTMGVVGLAAYAWLHWRAVLVLLRSAGELRGASAAFAGSLAGLFIQSKTGAMSWLAMFLGSLIAGSLFRGRGGAGSLSERSAAAALAVFGGFLAAAGTGLAWADFQAGLGNAQRARGLPRAAAARLERAVAWNPFETGYRLDLVNLLEDAASGIADPEARKLVLGRAAEVAAEGAKLRPGDAAAHRLLALSELRRFELAGEDRLAQAGAALDEAARLNPNLFWLKEDRRRLEESVKRR